MILFADTLKIVQMLFKNRKDAAQMIIPYLDRYKNKNSVVLAVPRGGVPVAYPIAKAYGWPLDLLMTKKIGHPSHSEFAIGAVNIEDYIIDDRSDVPQSYINDEVQKIRTSLKEKYMHFTEGRKAVDIENKTIIIIDDGVATGNTVLSAIKMLREKNPEKIVVAIPLAPLETAERIRLQVDDLICLYTPEPFIGVGQHYADFTQVNDQEVMELLRNANHFYESEKK
ncbi:phosphoribosyltransferase [Flavobacterium sp. Root420]|uniref:phosphoribosyltransferase n=1 Tax=Flavobacterium sp. Root420 TaxID=1736533 RepID=UPI0018E3F40F|nr:phosphoribosyltransferase family protein [Flavobacterium sp. Root420]